MLRDFGFVTLIDLTVSLGGVLLVLPAVLVDLRARAICVQSARGVRRAGPAACCRGCGAERAWRERRAVRPPRPGARTRLPSTGSTRTGRSQRPAARTRSEQAEPGDRHAAVPVDDRDLRARAGDRLLGLPVQHARGRRRRACRRASGCTTSSRRWRHRRSNGDANTNGRAAIPAHPNPLGAERVRARRRSSLALLRHRLGRCKREVDTLQAVSRQFPPERGSSSRRSRSAPGKRRRPRSCARTTGRSRSPSTATAPSARCTASRSARWSSWRDAAGRWQIV